MKIKNDFIINCGIGFLLVSVVFFVVVIIRSQNGIEGNFNILPFIAPLIFIPLLVYVIQSKGPHFYEKLYSHDQAKYSKSFCIWVISGLLLLVTVISAVLLYYGW